MPDCRLLGPKMLFCLYGLLQKHSEWGIKSSLIKCSEISGRGALAERQAWVQACETPNHEHLFAAAFLKAGPCPPPLSPTDAWCPSSAVPHGPFITGEGPFEKPATNWKNAPVLNSKKRRRERARNRKAPARLPPCPVPRSPPPPALGRDGTAANAEYGCYQPRAGAAVCSLLQPFFNRHLFFNKQDASAKADSFLLTSGRGAARVLLVAPGLLSSLPRGGRLQVHPGQRTAETTDLSPSCSPSLMSKTRSVQYRLGHVGEERLSFLMARFLWFHLRAVFKEVLVLRLGTKGTSKLRVSSRACSGLWCSMARWPQGCG